MGHERRQPEKTKKYRGKRAAAIIGTALVGAAAPGITARATETIPGEKITQHARHEYKKLTREATMETLQNRTVEHLSTGGSIDYFNGQIGYVKRTGTKRQYRIIKNPILVHPGNMRQNFQHSDMPSPVFGSISAKNGLRVTLHHFEDEAMYIPNSGNMVRRVQFTEDASGVVDFSEPIQPNRSRILDPAGNPEQIGLEYSPRK
jgi:hypothetical protein